MIRDPALSALRPVFLGCATLCLLVLGVFGWAATAVIDGAVIASGQIEVAHNRQIIQHPEGGAVRDLLITEGATVTQGQILLRLDDSLTQSALQAVNENLMAERAERCRLLAELSGADRLDFPPDLRGQPAAIEQTTLFQAKRNALARQTEQLSQRLDQIAAQTGGIRSQKTALVRQIALLQQDLTAQKTLLGKGLAQSARVTALERQIAQLQGDLGEAIGAEAQADGRATEVRLEINRLTDQRQVDAADALRSQTARLSELLARQTGLRHQMASLDIRAPVSGTVLGLQVSGPGAVVGPGQEIMAIVPTNRPLVAQVWLAISDIDAVHGGQPVRLVLTALPGRTTPQVSGRIITLSADAVPPKPGHAPLYKAEVSISPDQLRRLGHDLVPGMPVTALIETGPRSALAYLTRPLADYFRLAFRES